MQERVQVGGSQSEPLNVNVGVKQGCVVAPVLLSLFLLALYHVTHTTLGEDAGTGIQFRFDGNLFNLRQLQAQNKTFFLLRH